MAKPKLALIPAAQGSKLFSVLPSSGVGDFDFTRSGSATRINSQGLIETVDDGVSRLNYPMIDGKVVGCPHHILEPERRNLFTYSEDYSQSVWTKDNTTVTSGFISPDGSLNAYKILEDTSNGIHRLYPNFTVNSQKHTSSVFAKKGTRNWIFLRLEGLTENQRTWFDLENGVIGTVNSDHNASIEDYGNGWYRCSVSIKGTAYQSSFPILGIAEADNSVSYIGNGIGSIYIWGSQVEAGSYPTSYIPTNGEANGVTRQAETCNGAGDADTFNDSEGVLMVEASIPIDDATSRRISLTDGTINNRVSLEFDEAVNTLKLFIDSSVLIASGITKTNFNKISAKYKANDYALWVNGFEVATSSTQSNVPTGLDTLNFDNSTGANDFYGKTKQIQYYNSVLTDSELEQLTSWTSFTDMANGQLYTIE